MWPLRELLGSVMRLANQTRPDVSDAVRAVARVARPPKPKHWKAARGILEYLNGTSSYGVTFQRGSGLELIVYTGAPCTPNDTKRKAASGVAVMCGGNAVQWISRNKICTALPSNEAEYVVMTDCFKEAIFFRSVSRFLLRDFGDPLI